MSNILVTGGAGFIGSKILEAALRKGHFCICIDRFEDKHFPNIKRQNISYLLGHDSFSMVEGDILDLNLLKEVISENSIDYIYHQAAKVGVNFSIENPLITHEINSKGSINVIMASLDGGVKGIINASSSSVYGKSKYLPIDEEHPTFPISPYGVTKLIGEHYMRVFSELYDLSTVSLRYFTVYGPGMRLDNALSIFIKNALQNKDIEISGNGSYSRDYTYISDIVEANLLFMNKKFSGDVFNIGRGEGITIKELADTILELTGSKSKIKYSKEKKGNIVHELANTNKLEKKLNWKPKVSLEEGLKKFIEHFKKVEN